MEISVLQGGRFGEGEYDEVRKKDDGVGLDLRTHFIPELISLDSLSVVVI